MSSQLEIILLESGLDGEKADLVTKNFETCFALASEWDAKAKSIVVTSGDQKDEIALAREGRLLLREKRIAIEKTRVKMKEDILKEGRAIDAVAKKLTALIVPIEDYLEQQERFVQIEQEKKDAARRAEIEKRMAQEDEEKRRAEEASTAELRDQNDRLLKEAAERSTKEADERKAREAKEAADRAKHREAIEKERQKTAEIQARADAEKKAIEDKAREEREKAEAAKRAAAEKARKKLEAEREERERLEALLKAQVSCPKCSHKFVPDKKS